MKAVRSKIRCIGVVEKVVQGGDNRRVEDFEKGGHGRIVESGIDGDRKESEK